MAAAYAALVSLTNTMDGVMNDPRLSTCLDKEQIQSLRQRLGILLQFIENHTFHVGDEAAECLERRISSAADAAEDVIESHIVDQIHAGVLEKKAPSFLIDLHQIIQGVNHIKEEVAQFEGKRGTNNQKPKYSSAAGAAPSEPLTTRKTTMLGFDDYLNQLLDGLTGVESRRQIIPIVGMGGIGKTTLARNAYENLLTVQHFDVRSWVTISQQYKVREILMELLSSLGQVSKDREEKLEEESEGELSERLHKFLFGRRYLIILDDMWSFTAWERIRFFFPEDYNNSRIVVTTRLLEVANDFGSPRVVVMNLLDENKSWDLFCHKAFTLEAGCPAELQQIGKTIVKKCRGLSLAIVVIGALLRKSPQTKEHWENVAEDISSFLDSTEDNRCLDILCLSYSHLPARLKPCFLYLGIFPEDHYISVPQLIKLWVAEGFIKPDKDQRLEEIAESYLNDLYARNLILAHGWGWDGKCKSFYIHDLLRDLCLRIAEKEKFFCITRAGETIDRERRIVIRQGTPNQDFHTSKSSTRARSLIGVWGEPMFECRLLRVLVADDSDYTSYPPGVALQQQVNMRHLDYKCSLSAAILEYTYELPPSISLLWNLQTLIISYVTKLGAPPEIWKLRQLRYIEFWMMTLPEPPSSIEQDDDHIVLHDLHTLTRVEDFKCGEEVCKRIPNLKRLCVYIQIQSHKESLNCCQNIRAFQQT